MRNTVVKGGMIHVMAAIIWHPDQTDILLIARRQRGKHLQCYWELPGGKKTIGESEEQALQRELLEEIDIQAVSMAPFMQVTHAYCDRSILLDVWQISDFKGKVVGKEGQTIRWVATDELNCYRFPDANKPILHAIKNNAKA